jgi:hypothetical protein
VRNELTRFVSITPEGQPLVVMQVKYEKILRFYAVCGFLGHAQEECGSGVHPPETVGFGKWMLAEMPWNRSQLHDDPMYIRRVTDGVRMAERAEAVVALKLMAALEAEAIMVLARVLEAAVVCLAVDVLMAVVVVEMGAVDVAMMLASWL